MSANKGVSRSCTNKLCYKTYDKNLDACPACGTQWDEMAGGKVVYNKVSGGGSFLGYPASQWWIGVILGLIISLSVFYIKDNGDVVDYRETQIQSQFSAWNGAHHNLEARVKRGMRDPSSYEHVSTKYSDHGDYIIVTMTYRGSNGFGVPTSEGARAKVGLDGSILELIQ